MRGLSLVASGRGYSLLWGAGFPLQWLFLLWEEHGLCSCGALASLIWGMGNLPGDWPVSPASAGRFFITGPPGKSLGSISCYSLNRCLNAICEFHFTSEKYSSTLDLKDLPSQWDSGLRKHRNIHLLRCWMQGGDWTVTSLFSSNSPTVLFPFPVFF